MAEGRWLRDEMMEGGEMDGGICSAVADYVRGRQSAHLVAIGNSARKQFEPNTCWRFLL